MSESDVMQQDGNQIVKASSGWPRACYGVDLCSTGAVVVLAEKKHGRVVWDMARVNNTALAKAVDGQTVTAACVSARDSLTRRLEAPFSSHNKAKRVFPTLLDIQLPFSIEDCQYEFLDYRKTETGTLESLSVAATKDNIYRKISSVKEVGFDPEIIDIEGLAVWSQILHETEVQDTLAGEQIRVVLILDGDLSSLTIGRGKHFLNSYGLRRDDYKRVLRLIKAHQTNSDDSVLWFFAGQGADDKKVVTNWKLKLSEQSEQNINIVDEPTSFLARALAIRALSTESLKCNLRSGDMTHSHIAGHSLGVQFKYALLLLITGLLLCVSNLLVQHDIAERKAEVKYKFKDMVDFLAGYHVTAMGAQAVGIVKNSMVARKADLKPFLQAFEPSLLNVVANIIDVSNKNNLKCESLSLSYNKVSVTGTSAEFDASQELVAMLVRAGYLVSNKRLSATADERVPFSITTEQHL